LWCLSRGVLPGEGFTPAVPARCWYRLVVVLCEVVLTSKVALRHPASPDMIQFLEGNHIETFRGRGFDPPVCLHPCYLKHHEMRFFIQVITAKPEVVGFLCTTHLTRAGLGRPSTTGEDQ
jgi:hypothetical protein